MRREHRLRRSADFQRARTLGRSWSHPLLLCYAHYRDDDSPTRVGIIVSKRTGKAVLRNRVKRRLREAARALHPRFLPGWDVVLVPRPGTIQASVAEFVGALEYLLARSGIRGAPNGSSDRSLPVTGDSSPEARNDVERLSGQ